MGGRDRQSSLSAVKTSPQPRRSERPQSPDGSPGHLLQNVIAAMPARIPEHSSRIPAGATQWQAAFGRTAISPSWRPREAIDSPQGPRAMPADRRHRRGTARAPVEAGLRPGCLAHLACHLLQCRDAVLGRGMGREQIIHAMRRERIDDEEMRGRRRCALPSRSRSPCAAFEILASAEASASAGRKCARRRVSAAYSRVRLIAICTIMAASGATIIISQRSDQTQPIVAVADPPPKNRPNCASMEMAPAMVAVMVMVSVSWLRMWASSCASTPAISSRLSALRRPGAHRDRGMLGIASGGEGVRLRIVHDIDTRHREAGALREIAHEWRRARARCARRPRARRAGDSTSLSAFQ